METFDPINTALLLVITVVLSWYLRDRFASIDKRLETLEQAVAEIRTLLAGQQGLIAGQQGRLDEISREIAGMRSDQIQIALAVGAKARPETA